MTRDRPGVLLTVDAVWIDRGRVLLVRRGRAPFRGWWALPGGFVDPDETAERAVLRELQEETGLRARSVRLLGLYSGPERDPRRNTASAAFLVQGQARLPEGGDDAATAAWVPLDRVRRLAFDHGLILRDATRRSGSWSRTRPTARR